MLTLWENLFFKYMVITIGINELYCKYFAGGGQIFGRSKASLIPKSNGYYSRATFSNVAIFPGNSYD